MLARYQAVLPTVNRALPPPRPKPYRLPKVASAPRSASQASNSAFQLGRAFTVIDMRELRISDAATRSGRSATTLPCRESTGLITSIRTATGYRLVKQRDLERLRFLGAAKRLDMSLHPEQTA